MEVVRKKALEEIGVKVPLKGAKVLVYLTTTNYCSDSPGKGWYFESNNLRSPLSILQRDLDRPFYSGRQSQLRIRLF